MKAIRNLNQILTLRGAHKKDGRQLLPEDLDAIENGSIVFNDQEIVWIGEDKNFPTSFLNTPSIPGSGHLLSPELVDSHTHLVFGGDRSHEYMMRLNGEDYTKIAQSGGGILYTVEQTRSASFETLFNESKKRILKMYHLGVGSIEIKTGYGLDEESEMKILSVINKLKNELAPQIEIFRTFMGAHAVPNNLTSENYIKNFVIPFIKKNHRQFDAVDIFLEEGYFSLEDVKNVFNVAKDHSLLLKIHADEFKNLEGAETAVKYNCLSADHLLAVSEIGIKALAKSNTIATILPGTALFLGKKWAPTEKLLRAGAKVAIATDFNPGSCHFPNLLDQARLCAPSYKMNVAQVWASITLNASHALGKMNQGALIEGQKPRFTFFKCKNIDQLMYSWGENFVDQSINNLIFK